MSTDPPLRYESSGSGERLIILHGFTQSARTWGAAGDALAARYQVVAIDAPGHGRSASVSASLPDGADLMAETAAAAGGGGTWLGYSMGGRYALHVALRHPDLVDRLVLVSATAGIDDQAERAARRDSDDGLARRVEDEGLEPFVRWWLGQPLFASLPAEAAQVEARLEGSASGLAASLRLAGTGTQEPLWDRLTQLQMPVLVVAGSLDSKYVALGRRLADAIGPSAAFQVIPAAGHACHLEQPAAFVDVVTAWLG